MSLIRHLEPHLINQIAAGEVVERPASVMKELVENALDAGARNLVLSWRQGGQSLIRIEDDGKGMSKEDLVLAVQRHTTSKLPTSDLSAISSFGFRGEALAAIASVARVTISSRTRGCEHGWSLVIEGGEMGDPTPTPCSEGTTIEVSDLFFATPARLKFMRSVAIEQSHIIELIERIALAHPDVGLTIHYETKKKVYTLGFAERLKESLGDDFFENSFSFAEEKEGYRLTGMLGLPTHNRSCADRQFFFVNGRPVKDKILSMCLKSAFMDVIPQGRHPVGVLFFTLPLHDVDVNVHPAKTEVRFRDMRFVRGFVTSVLKNSIFEQGHRAAVLDVTKIPHTIPPMAQEEPMTQEEWKEPVYASSRYERPQAPSFARVHSPLFSPHFVPSQKGLLPSLALKEEEGNGTFSPPAAFLGQALGQIHDAYIVACTPEGLVLVDPHAAHERIVYEKMKSNWAESLGHIQRFLLSLNFSLTLGQEQALTEKQTLMHQLGFEYEIVSHQCRLLSIPLIFRAYDPMSLVQDLALHIQTQNDPQEIVTQWRNHMMANWSCRQSLKLGQRMTLVEMNALLRQIEETPHSAQCNHGRPVYRTFSMRELERMFERH